MAIPSMNASDMHLLSVISSQSSAEVLRNFYEKSYKALCEYAAKRVNDPQSAADIVADSFDRLMQQPDHISTGHLEEYLYAAINNRCTDYLRLQERTAKNAVPIHVITPTEEAEIEAEICSLMYDELSKLPPQRKQIMIQLFMKGLSTKAVAKRMRLSRQTVLNQKVRALKTLRNNILRRIF